VAAPQADRAEAAALAEAPAAVPAYQERAYQAPAYQAPAYQEQEYQEQEYREREYQEREYLAPECLAQADRLLLLPLRALPAQCP
jgi:hypothetical protein